MKIECIEVDTRVFRSPVLAIRDFNPEQDFEPFEQAYVKEYKPFYVSCKIPIEDVASIHLLENVGFRVIECQIRSTIKLRSQPDTSAFPYAFLKVDRREDLSDVLEIAGTTFAHDRFCADPWIGRELSGARYREYVLKSFQSPEEAVYRLIDQSTGRVVAFKTHRYISGTEVLFLLGGVHNSFKNCGLGVISELFEFRELIGKGIRSGTTHISAGNYPIFNLEIGKLGFRVARTFAVLRKLYTH